MWVVGDVRTLDLELVNQKESPMTTMNDEVDVLVVGAGPSGLTVAAALARAGVRALTVDRHAGTSTFPKATGVRLRTMEILRSWGLADQVPENAGRVRLAMSVSPTLAGPQLQEISLGVPDDGRNDAVSPTGFAFCAQDRLEPILLGHARERGGEVRFGTELVGLTQVANGVLARLRGAHGGPPYDVLARYVVGADGGGSTVRAAAGIGWQELGSEGHHLALLFRADLSEAVRGRSFALHATVAPGAEGMFVSTGDPHRWVFDLEWQPSPGDSFADWTPDRVRRTIRAASGLPHVEPRVEGLFRWEFGAAVAETQRKGRIFLVGDAAHRTTPRRATGMNTGIADAHNLGWKLAWVLQGRAHPDLLDSYDAERRPVGLANARRSLVPAADDTSETDVLADDLGVVYRSGVVAALEPESPGTAAVPGSRAPHAWVIREGERISTLDLFGDELTIVTGRDGSAWQSAVDGLVAEGIPARLVAIGRDVSDPDGVAAAAYGVGRTGAVLVRPDGHVAWRRGAAPTNAAQVLRAACATALGHGPAALLRAAG
jgi:2-polyprenyl-6-methoxyphenol hydroxylase-like FAD-dependent oxidoreductase